MYCNYNYSLLALASWPCEDGFDTVTINPLARKAWEREEICHRDYQKNNWRDVRCSTEGNYNNNKFIVLAATLVVVVIQYFILTQSYL